MSKNLEDHRISLLLEEYKILREEILESIRLQNRIIMGVGTAMGIILGFGLTEDKYSALILAIPIVVAVLTSWWVAEQSRMMRAGNFMQFIEDKINREVEGAYIVWENWLRRRAIISGKKEGIVQRVKEVLRNPHKLHHVAQFICVIGVFYGISIISLILFFLYEPLNEVEIGIRLILALFPASILGILLLPIVIIILHQGSEAEKEDLNDWLGGYWTKTKSMWEGGKT